MDDLGEPPFMETPPVGSCWIRFATSKLVWTLGKAGSRNPVFWTQAMNVWCEFNDCISFCWKRTCSSQEFESVCSQWASKLFYPTYMLLYSDILGKEKHGFPWVSSFPSFYPLTPVPQTVSSLRRAAEQPKICVVSDFDEMLDAWQGHPGVLFIRISLDFTLVYISQQSKNDQTLGFNGS